MEGAKNNQVTKMAADGTTVRPVPHFVKAEERSIIQSAQIWIARLFAVSFWAYVLLHVFVFNVDSYLVSRLPSELAWIIKLKFFLLLFFGLLLVWFSSLNRFVFYFLYVVFFPVIRVGKFFFLLFSKRRWLALIAVLNFLVSSFKSFSFSLQIFAFTCFAWALVLLDFGFLNLLGAAISMALFLCILVHSFRVGRRPDSVVAIYLKLIPINKFDEVDGPFCLPAEYKGGELSELSEDKQLDCYQRLEKAVLVGRASSFLAEQLLEYEESDWRLVPTALGFLGMVFGNVVFFALCYAGISGFDSGQFSISSDSRIFDFVFFSFSNIIFSSISGIDVSGDISKSVVMVQSFSILFMLAILFSSFYNARDDRFKKKIREISEELRGRSESVEAFVASEFGPPDYEAAIAQLKTGSATLLNLFLSIIDEGDEENLSS